MIDLTETQRLKEELQSAPEKYKTILEESELAICITDEEGTFLDVNSNYCKLYGYSKEELIGKHFTLVISAEKEQIQISHPELKKNKLEILRNWIVIRKGGELIKISADALYSETLFSKPCTITFVFPEDKQWQGFLKKEKTLL